MLGSGDGGLESGLLSAAARHPGKIGVITGYDEALAHLMQAGGDAILIPSRFEPCGLTQLYGLHYGCVPVVARTGGLADTVVDANDAALAANAATGILHQPGSGDAFKAAIDRAIELYGQPGLWRDMQKRGMRTDVSWDRSSALYADIYERLVG